MFSYGAEALLLSAALCNSFFLLITLNNRCLAYLLVYHLCWVSAFLSLCGCRSVRCVLVLLLLFLCGDLVSGEDLERNDGSSSRPYYMSPGLHKILRKGEEGAKTCAASWVMHFTKLLALWLTSPYLPCAWGSGRSRASTVGLTLKLDAPRPACQGWPVHERTCCYFGSSQKRHRGLR